MLDSFINEFNVGDSVPPAQYSPLVLAYIGDCVFELYVRTYLIREKNAHVKDLHRAAANLVNNKSQSDLYIKIKDILTEEEEAVYKRGRNTNSRPPKNAVLRDYKSATGIEALIGYLYLMKNSNRIKFLMKYLIDDLD